VAARGCRRSGEFDLARVVAYSLVAAGYLAGSVLVVRSVLRERGNGTFAALTVPVSLTGATSSRMLDNR